MKRVVVGFGARAGVPAPVIAAAVRAVLGTLGEPRIVATVGNRVRDPGVRKWAVEESLILLGFSAARLARVRVPTPSMTVKRVLATPSVAEAAALLAAGPGAVLLIPKTISGPVTVAVARRC